MTIWHNPNCSKSKATIQYLEDNNIKYTTREYLKDIPTKDEIQVLKNNGTIHGGMVPKVDACLDAIEGGVQKAHIIDGRVEHSILLELLTSEGIGTEIKEK